MGLGLISYGDSEKDLIQKLKLFGSQIEHKFQQRRGFDIDPSFLDKTLEILHKLDKITTSHQLKNKISNLDTIITAATRYFLDSKYEEYYERVKVIADKLNNLEEKIL